MGIMGGPDPGRPGDKPDVPATDRRSMLETTFGPLGLAILGLVMIVAAVIVYPRAGEPPAPDFATLEINSKFPINSVSYLVHSLSSTTDEVTIFVDRPGGTARPSADKPAARLGVEMPAGVSFWDCPSLPCAGPAGRRIHRTLNRPLTFHSTGGSSGQAAVYLFVIARNFGVTANGVMAAATMPAVFWEAPGQGLLYAGVGLRAATSYDWAPAARSIAVATIWTEPLNQGYTPGLNVTGIDHAARTREDFLNFLAGALIALGVAAMLAAIVEAVHKRDWDAIRTLRQD